MGGERNGALLENSELKIFKICTQVVAETLEMLNFSHKNFSFNNKNVLYNNDGEETNTHTDTYGQRA